MGLLGKLLIVVILSIFGGRSRTVSASASESAISIPKCCRENQLLILDPEPTCVNSSLTWRPPIFQNGAVVPRIPINFTEWDPDSCIDGVLLDTREFDGARYLIRIQSTGQVVVKGHPSQPWRALIPGKYCVEGVLRNITLENQNGVLDGENDFLVVDCSGPDEMGDQVFHLLYLLASAVACLFLLLTVLCYLILWERQNIHSWTLLGYAISTLLLHADLFATHIHNYRPLGEEEEWGCLILASTSHFLYLSVFAWLSLINLDVWWTFSKLSIIRGGKSGSLKRFAGYLTFPILLPLLVISIGLILGNEFKDDLETSVVYLEYSMANCSISEYSVFYYKFLPVTILLGANFLFFLLTIRTLHRIGESTKMASKSSHGEGERSKLTLFVKLFFVMGLIWGLELLSYFLFGSFSSHPIAYVLDMITILQPIAIFLIFVCKGDILRGLQVKLPCLQKLFQITGIARILNRSRTGSGLSSASVTTQISTCSTRSSARSDAGFEMNTEPGQLNVNNC